jgi:hypothetical protein
MMLAEGSWRHVRRHWAVFAGLALAMAIWCGVDVQRRAIVDPARPHLHMTDFTVYTEAGAAFFDGRPPYEVTNLRGWKYLYPPLFALLVAPLSALSASWQATLWFAVSVLLCLGSYFECRRLLAGVLDEQPAPRRFMVRLGIIAGAAAIFPVLNCLQRGQIGVILLYPLLVGLRLVLLGETRRAWFAGGLVLALPVVLKLTPLLPVGCLLVALLAASWRRAAAPQTVTGVAHFLDASQTASLNGPRSSSALTNTLRVPMWSAGGVLAGGVIFALALPAGLIGWQSNLRHLATWYEHVATKVDHDRTDHFAGDGSTVRNQSLTNAVSRFGNWAAFEFAGGPDDRLVDRGAAEFGTMPMDRPAVHTAVLGIRGIAALVLVAAVVALGRCGDRVSLGFAFGLACVATFIVSPVARGHYFMLYVPAILFGSLWMFQRRSARTALRFTVIPALLCLAHYLALNHAGRIGLLGIGTALWFFTACATVLVEAARARTQARISGTNSLRQVSAKAA